MRVRVLFFEVLLISVFALHILGYLLWVCINSSPAYSITAWLTFLPPPLIAVIHAESIYGKW